MLDQNFQVRGQYFSEAAKPLKARSHVMVNDARNLDPDSVELFDVVCVVGLASRRQSDHGERSQS